MPTAPKSAKKKTAPKRRAAPPPAPQLATAVRDGPLYHIEVGLGRLLINGREMPTDLAAAAIAAMLERAWLDDAKARK